LDKSTDIVVLLDKLQRNHDNKFARFLDLAEIG